jgi:hypothetical protein
MRTDNCDAGGRGREQCVEAREQGGPGRCRDAEGAAAATADNAVAAAGKATANNDNSRNTKQRDIFFLIQSHRIINGHTHGPTKQKSQGNCYLQEHES